MTKLIHVQENEPFPNNPLPVLHYPKAVSDLTGSPDAAQNVLDLFEKNGYTNGWINGIFSYHHFHANTHEALACVSGEAMVQLGGPDSKAYLFQKGDVMLLPAGMAHKRVDATEDFRIIGAYPDGMDPDMQKGETENYEKIKQRIADVPLPKTDPVEGKDGAVSKHWMRQNVEQ